jgi:hypothetical protein
MLVRSAKIFNFKGLVVAEPQVSAVSTLTSLSAFLRSWSGNSALDIATVDANRPPANVTVSPAIGVCKYRTAEVRAIKDTAIVSPATPTLHKGRIWAARGVEAAVPQVGIVVAVTTPNISRFKIRYTVVNAITSLDTVATADIGRHEAGYKVSKYGISSLVEDIAVITTINPTRFTGISTPRGVVSGDIDGVSADTITFRVPSLPPRTIAVRPLSVTSVTDDGMTSCTGDVVRYGTGRVRGWCYGYDIGDAATVDTVQTHKSWISHIASFDTDMMLETVSAGEVELEIKGKRWVPHIAKFDTDMMLETVSADTTQDATRSQGLHRVRYRAWEFDISTTKDDTATEAARERQRILYAATFYLPYSDDSYEFWS